MTVSALSDVVARLGELPSITAQRMPCGQLVLVGLFVPHELGCSTACRPCALCLSHTGTCGAMPLSSTIQPSMGAGAVGGVADQTIGLHAEALLDPLDHRLGRFDLLRSMRWRGLDVHDDPGLQIDQVVGRVGVERRPARCGGPARRGIGQRDVLARRRWLRWLVVVVARRVGLFERIQVLAHGAARSSVLAPVGGLGPRNTARAVGVGLDDAGVDREAFAADQAFAHAATQHALEYMPQGVALAEAAVPVLGEGRVVRDRVFQVQPAEPAIRQVQVDLLAQPALGANAEAVADDQHADHQLRIDRWAAGVAVERR